MNQSSAERLGKFRQTMKDRGLDAWIGRIVDPHLSEYVPEHWQSVAWLTGFTGSTARLCVTDRKSTRQNSSHGVQSRMPSSA